jgi:hypothetical protein
VQANRAAWEVEISWLAMRRSANRKGSGFRRMVKSSLSKGKHNNRGIIPYITDNREN